MPGALPVHLSLAAHHNTAPPSSADPLAAPVRRSRSSQRRARLEHDADVGLRELLASRHERLVDRLVGLALLLLAALQRLDECELLLLQVGEPILAARDELLLVPPLRVRLVRGEGEGEGWGRGLGRGVRGEG